jgi:hypothetical protein
MFLGCSLFGVFRTAEAAILLAVTSTAPVEVYDPPGVVDSPVIIDFNGATAGGTTFTFRTTGANQRVIITFNAECQIPNGNFTPASLDIDIVVNPFGPAASVVVPPSNGDNIFCQNIFLQGSAFYPGAAGSNAVSASVVTTMTLPTAGTHTVRVRALLDGPTLTATLDHMSLTIMR